MRYAVAALMLMLFVAACALAMPGCFILYISLWPTNSPLTMGFMAILAFFTCLPFMIFSGKHVAYWIFLLIKE